MANGTIIPLYKGSDSRAEPDKYRGITLLNTIYKCYSLILHNKLYAWCQQSEVLPEQQFGFINGKSTHKAIESLNSEIENSVTNKGKLYAVLVDFRKAFDTIDRTMLIRKLVTIVVTRDFFCMLHDILKYNELRIVNGSYLSEKITQKVGVSQGDKLSPLLFILFVADLPEVINNCGCRCIFYADDLVLTSDKVFDVQLALYRIGIYCNDHNGYMSVFRQPRIQTGQYLDKYCFNQSESRQRRN